MGAIRIAPAQVRTSGVAAVAAADDLRGQAAALTSTPLPPMTAPMAAQHESALASIATRLGAVANDYGAVGEELQVRAAAAELADAPGASRSLSAGQQLARSVVTTATIVGAAGTTTTARLTATGTNVVAATSSGLRLTIPDALEQRPVTATAARAAAPDPQDTAHERPAVSRDVGASALVAGPPAAIVRQAAMQAPPVDAPGGVAGASFLRGDAIDPSAMAPGIHRAERRDDRDRPAAVDMPAADDGDRQHWACWMASSAPSGVPPVLPVMMALAQSGMRNLPAGGGDVGFFGVNPHTAYAPAGFGVARDAQPDGAWWAAHPDAQLDHVVGQLGDLGGGIRTPGLDDPDALGRWASEAVPGLDPAQFSDAHTAAAGLVDGCRQAHAAGIAGGSALSVARSQLGVHELSTNAGPEINQYLASAGVSSGNPWCASFVNWSLHESGHDMPGGGWASVSTWVDAAQHGQHGLHFVDPAAARPGDIVAYDWGGQSDFGSDGHIGLLDSHVSGGHFTAVEGNAQDAVTRMDRSLDVGHVVFIRLAA